MGGVEASDLLTGVTGVSHYRLLPLRLGFRPGRHPELSATARRDRHGIRMIHWWLALPNDPIFGACFKDVI